MADRIEQIKIQEMISKIKAENPSASVEQIISILNNSPDGIKLTENQLISILQSNNQIEEPSLENKSEQRLIQLRQRIDNAKSQISNAEKNNGAIGNLWSSIKNTTGIGDSSNDVRTIHKAESDSINKGDLKTAFFEITGTEYNEENFNKFLNGEIKTKSETALEEYKIGQEDSSDFAGDMVSGFASMGLYTLAIAAVTTMGAPIAAAAGVALAGAAIIGAGVKVATKALDASAGDKTYDTLGKDVVTGAINGLIAPIASCFGGRIAASAVSKIGGQAIKEGTEAIAREAIEETTENFFKSAMLNPMGNIYKGNLAQKATGYIVELGFDGGVSGGADAATRAAYEGKSIEEIGDAAIQGTCFGAGGGILLGSAMKAAGNYLHNKGVDTGNSLKGANHSGSLPTKITSLTEVFHKAETTNNEAIEILKKYGITEEEYLTIPQYPLLNDVIRVCDFLYDTEVGGSFKDKTKNEILDFLTEASECTEEIKYCQFINKENLEIVTQLEYCKPEKTIKQMCELFNFTGKSEAELCKYFEIARELDYPLSSLIYYLDNPSTITLKELKIQKRLDELEDGIFYPTDNFKISDPSKINAKFFEEYGTIIKELKENGVYMGRYNDPIKKLEDAKQLLTAVKELDMDFKKSELHSSIISSFLSKYPLEQVKDFTSKLSDDCKALFKNDMIIKFLNEQTQENLNLNEYAGLFNTIAELKTLRNNNDNTQKNSILDWPTQAIKEAMERGITVKELTTFFNACKDMNWMPNDTYFLKLLKPDIELSTNILKELKKLCDSEYGKDLNFERFIYGNFNGKEYTPDTITNIRKILENKVHVYNIDLINVFISKPESIKNFALLSKSGIKLDNSKTAMNLLTEYPAEQIIQGLDKLKSIIHIEEGIDPETLFYITNQDNSLSHDILNKLLNNEEIHIYITDEYKRSASKFTDQFKKIEGLEEFCSDLINNPKSEFPKKYISDIIGTVRNQETFELTKEICTNKEYARFWDNRLTNLCNELRPKGIEFSKRLLARQDIEPSVIGNIIKACRHDNDYKIADFILNDKEASFPIKQIPFLIDNWFDKNSIDALLFLLRENPRNFTPENIIAIAGGLSDNGPIFYKMCDEKSVFENDDIVKIMIAIERNNGRIFFNDIFDKITVENKEFIPDIIEYRTSKNRDLAYYLFADTDRNFPKKYIVDILKNTRQLSNYNKDFVERLCRAKDFPAEYIADIIGPKGTIICADIIEKLCFDKALNFPKDNIGEIAQSINPETNLDLATVLCFDKDLNWNPDNIANILKHSTKETQETIISLCRNKNFPRDLVEATAQQLKEANTPLLEQTLKTEGLDLKALPSILECTICKDNINRGNVDEKKVKGFINILQNPTTSKFAIKLLNEGFDMDTVAFLSKTKKKLSAEANKQPKVENRITDSFNSSQIESYEVFTSHGLGEKEALAIIKAISTDGRIDHNMQAKALSLIDLGIAKNKIGDILNQAKINSEYNPKIVDDFVILQNKGLNPLLEKNLAIINNISGHDTFFKFNPKVRKQMLGMISNLSDNQKSELSKNGIDTESIVKKLEIRIEQSTLGKVKVKSGLRSKASLAGFEKVVVNKYNPAEDIWRNPEACKTWADKKYLDFRNHDYSSRLYPNANADRTRIFNDWFEFLDNDGTIKENPFAKIIITEFITNNVEPENAWLPPEFDKEIAKDLLSSALNDSQNISFSKAYTEKLRAKAELGTEKEEIFVDGFKGTWYTVPQTDKSAPNFKSNVEKIKTFSDGTNWCIRTFNAAPYTQLGAMHFFVDENGLTQVCIRENGYKHIAEIQKRQQDGTCPIAYINVIQDFIERKELNTQAGYLDNAINAKPKYDKIRAELTTLMSEHNYKAILEKMGIKVTTLPDGTWELSHYTPDIEQFKVAEFNVKEDLLLQNVSRIKGNANFSNSNATALPKLEEVTGTFQFDESQISDVRSLKTINGKKVIWE